MKSTVKAALGYDMSPNFVPGGELARRTFRGHAHVYRQARELCGLQGAYLLSDPGRPSDVPVVFYCKALSDTGAEKIHQRVWNQGVAPFVLVETPRLLRLYSGFRFNPKGRNDVARGVLEAAVAFNEVADRLDALHSRAIDSGAVWDRWADQIDSRGRVDWTLLEELEKLGAALRERGLAREHAHALMGKYVYLKYLRDRDILSDRKLGKWNLTAQQIFGHNATLKAFGDVNRKLDDWLNGSVFPLANGALRAEHLQLVASVFAGGTTDGQLSLDLGIYDFSLIPIETLSVIYQQFLHAPQESGPSRGRESGAYYTPIPVVNYMLSELHNRRPLKEGMTVLDPSCGSGAFLVQCYRTLIERRLKKGKLRPTELRKLLEKHIYGVDRDEDACRVAELSLILTLLDYTVPPDLESNPQFKLPMLRDNNIFCADYFELDSAWAGKRPTLQVDWLVGNPPWREAKQSAPLDRPALQWMKANQDECPTGGNQLAEAFVWHSLPLLHELSVSALLLPAMTLFKFESTGFRARLFDAVRTWGVTNFANLAYVLFAGRSEAPAMSLFFELRDGDKPEYDEPIWAFAPFRTNQRGGRVDDARRGRDTWNVVVNGAEMRELRFRDVAAGDFRPWKEAMWGSFRDRKILDRVARKFPTLEKFAREHDLNVHEGLQLRKAGSGEETQPGPELAGKKQVDFSKLKHCGRIYSFPESALSVIPEELANVRKRGGLKGLEVSKPPHIIVDASRRFAVYSDEFIAIPARQIGVAASSQESVLMRALALYLGSDFCRYQQFFMTPQMGVSVSIATLKSFRTLPIPLASMNEDEICEWANMQRKMMSDSEQAEHHNRLVDQRVYEALGLSTTEQTLVEDFVCWNLKQIKGKVASESVVAPTEEFVGAYLETLKRELDVFIGSEAGVSHDVCVVRGDGEAMIAIQMKQGQTGKAVILESSSNVANQLRETRSRLLEQHAQWLYFERCLGIYDDGRMYMFKPLETIHWTRRQAILDAGQVIAESVTAGAS